MQHLLPRRCAELDRTDPALISERRIERSESHYRNLFAQSPIAIWEEDFTTVRAWLDGLETDGVLDLQGYFDERPR